MRMGGLFSVQQRKEGKGVHGRGPSLTLQFSDQDGEGWKDTFAAAQLSSCLCLCLRLGHSLSLWVGVLLMLLLHEHGQVQPRGVVVAVRGDLHLRAQEPVVQRQRRRDGGAGREQSEGPSAFSAAQGHSIILLHDLHHSVGHGTVLVSLLRLEIGGQVIAAALAEALADGFLLVHVN